MTSFLSMVGSVLELGLRSKGWQMGRKVHRMADALRVSASFYIDLKQPFLLLSLHLINSIFGKQKVLILIKFNLSICSSYD